MDPAPLVRKKWFPPKLKQFPPNSLVPKTLIEVLTGLYEQITNTNHTVIINIVPNSRILGCSLVVNSLTAMDVRDHPFFIKLLW
jgi:hypothetical protein